MTPPILLAVPNVSEGREEATIAAIGQAFSGAGLRHERASGAGETSAGSALGVRLLDVHSDPDHHRSVFTLAGRQGELAQALLAGARTAVERIDVMSRARGERSESGQHPHVGALDVAPIVYLQAESRGAACAEALVVADRIGDELGVPVFLYGVLSRTERRPARGRAELRRGGVGLLARRIAAAESSAVALPQAQERGSAGKIALSPDFGPCALHATAGASLVAARPPLVAFNLQLAPPATLADARRIAALIREGGELGLPGVRAIGVQLSRGLAQLSMNVERPFEVPLSEILEAAGRHARVQSAELVGLAPRVALEGFPEDVPMPGFDAERHVIENALGC
ncbi:MAG: hypothetical protein ABSG95_04545 [Solirubrobacteraceae bacterium]|jgi:glutamate formiminotransferase/glutamate formiminotransferase/formiminotetrahydrofolate cyclodeaminase